MGKTLKMRISGSGIADNGLDEIKAMQKLLAPLQVGDEYGNLTNLKEVSYHDLVTTMDDIRQLDLTMAESAISCLHDALLGVAKGRITPEEVADFFWSYDLEKATFIGGVIKFDEPENIPPHPIEEAQHG